MEYVSLDDAFSKADFLSIRVALLRVGESQTPTYHL